MSVWVGHGGEGVCPHGRVDGMLIPLQTIIEVIDSRTIKYERTGYPTTVDLPQCCKLYILQNIRRSGNGVVDPTKDVINALWYAPPGGGPGYQSALALADTHGFK